MIQMIQNIDFHLLHFHIITLPNLIASKLQSYFVEPLKVESRPRHARHCPVAMADFLDAGQPEILKFPTEILENQQHLGDLSRMGIGWHKQHRTLFFENILDWYITMLVSAF